MRALKLLVVGMGVLLVLGAAALVWAVIYKVNHRPATPAVATAPAAAGARTVIDLPPGGRLEGSEVAGDRLVLRLARPDGGHEVLLFDLRNGARLATIELRPTGASGASAAGESKP